MANYRDKWEPTRVSCRFENPLPDEAALRAAITPGSCLLLPPWERATVVSLGIFNRATLVAFWTKHKDAEGPLRLWSSIVERAKWTGPPEVRAAFGSADFLADSRVVFDIKGNRYRIVAQIKYAPLCLVYIRFIGTHTDYAKIDARSI